MTADSKPIGDAVTSKVHCGNCGKPLSGDLKHGIPPDRDPCPHCGSLRRDFRVEILENVGEFRARLDAVSGEQELRKLEAEFVGQKGKLTVGRKRWFANSDKKATGEAYNGAVKAIDDAVGARLAAAAILETERDLERTVDVTLPGRTPRIGHLHPVTHARRAIAGIFARLGFAIAEGPQVETDFYNFEALAMPKDHPARDMQDTFYLRDEPDLVLRTHTSPVQIRTMLAQPPPVRVICMGAVFRRDDDPTHVPMFHQVEGLMVDTRVTFAEL
jgi:phenylalanyl-tRNA synthetase alpha chain